MTKDKITALGLATAHRNLHSKCQTGICQIWQSRTPLNIYILTTKPKKSTAKIYHVGWEALKRKKIGNQAISSSESCNILKNDKLDFG